MNNFPQFLREGALEAAKDKTPEEKAFALNLIEAIIEGEMSVNEILDAISEDTLPKRYIPTGR